MLMQMGAGGAYALSLAVIVAAIYLAVVRFMDLNEKEPLWAVALLFALGAVAAGILYLVVGSRLLELTVLPAALATEAAKLVAIAIGVAALGAIARARGWAEINGIMDGVVYGTAVGFGYAVGETFIRNLAFAGTALGAVNVSPLATLWTTVLTGLSDGLFGGIIGAGFGAAAAARTSGARVGYPIVGFVAAVIAHAAYILLATGNSLGGGQAVVRTWIALLIPLVFVVAVVALALGRERRAILEELANESESGVVSEEEFSLLRSFGARRAHYARLFMSGNFDDWLDQRALHNRQVQLALAERRLRGFTGAEERAEAEGDVERIRASILQMKRSEAAESGSAEAGKAGA